MDEERGRMKTSSMRCVEVAEKKENELYGNRKKPILISCTCSRCQAVVRRSENLKESFFMKTTFLWLQLQDHKMKKKIGLRTLSHSYTFKNQHQMNDEVLLTRPDLDALGQTPTLNQDQVIALGNSKAAFAL